MGSVRDVDHGYKAFKERMDSIKTDGSYTRVGLFSTGQAREEGEISNVDLGVIHEFGAPAAHIPERSWLRSAFDANIGKWNNFAEDLTKKIVDGKMNVFKALSFLGLRASADVKLGITSGAGIPPPNAPSTIARKGSSRTLVGGRKGTPGHPGYAGGQFVGAITYDVSAETES